LRARLGKIIFPPGGTGGRKGSELRVELGPLTTELARIGPLILGGDGWGDWGWE
jgi:hypothetical protein